MWEMNDANQPPSPDFDVLVVNTVTMMSTWAGTLDSERDTRLHSLMADKIVSNLFVMRTHPHAQGPMGCALSNAYEQWRQISQSGSAFAKRSA
jgi:hypothetical protein